MAELQTLAHAHRAAAQAQFDATALPLLRTVLKHHHARPHTADHGIIAVRQTVYRSPAAYREVYEPAEKPVELSDHHSSVLKVMLFPEPWQPRTGL